MPLACVESCASLGLDAPRVRVEVHLSGGLPGLTIVGLPETAVRESKDRVRSALLNSGYAFPSQRITINLAPADLPKEGGRFDLPIALGILAASGQIPARALEGLLCLGELALSGQLRAVSGALTASLAAGAGGLSLLLPSANGHEAALPAGTRVLAASSLGEVVAHLRGQQTLSAHVRQDDACSGAVTGPDLASLRGQQQARRALEIAAAGGHSLLLQGPPGSGKSLLASCLPGLLPSLDAQQQMEVAALHSLVGSARLQNASPPCRSPHHAVSRSALIGGGAGVPRPGEISLAHHGVLFLDELPEFARDALEALRQPLEAREVVLTRARRQVVYPAAFQLVAAMNPCPCGQQGLPESRCRCTPEQLARYRGRLSGPLLDRIDLRLQLQPVPLTLLHGDSTAENSAEVRTRVLKARTRQLTRQGRLNADLPGEGLTRGLAPDDARFLQEAGTRLGLSARAYHRVLRVAHTISDLTGEAGVGRAALAEALVFR